MADLGVSCSVPSTTHPTVDGRQLPPMVSLLRVLFKLFVPSHRKICDHIGQTAAPLLTPIAASATHAATSNCRSTLCIHRKIGSNPLVVGLKKNRRPYTFLGKLRSISKPSLRLQRKRGGMFRQSNKKQETPLMLLFLFLSNRYFKSCSRSDCSSPDCNQSNKFTSQLG